MSARGSADVNELTSRIIGAAIEVHRELGPGLLESAYEESLAHEFALRHIPFERQKPVPQVYKGVRLDVGFRIDFVVNSQVAVELKAVETLQPVHEAHVLTYLKLTGLRIALLINFNAKTIHKGLRRLVLNLQD